jgi:hypothetical protein
MRRSHSFTGHVIVKLCLGEFWGFNFGHSPAEEEVSGQNSSHWGNDIGKMKDGIDRPRVFASNDGNRVEINC